MTCHSYNRRAALFRRSTSTCSLRSIGATIPGEKRLLTHVSSFTILPHDFVTRWQAMLRVPNDDMLMVAMLEALIVDFEQLLEDHE